MNPEMQLCKTKQFSGVKHLNFLEISLVFMSSHTCNILEHLLFADSVVHLKHKVVIKEILPMSYENRLESLSPMLDKCSYSTPSHDQMRGQITWLLNSQACLASCRWWCFSYKVLIVIIVRASDSARLMYCVVPPTHHTQCLVVEENGNWYFRYLYCEVLKIYVETLNKAQQPPQCDLKHPLSPKFWKCCQ